MLNLEQHMDIIDLHKQGLNISQIAKATGHDRKTIRLRLANPNNPPTQRKDIIKTSKLDPYKDHIKQRHEEFDLSAVRLLEEVHAMGYQGSERSIRRFLSTLKAGTKAASKLTSRFETPPGKQAQVDWFEPGVFTYLDGTTQKVYGFEIVLGASRLAYCVYTTDMTMSTLLRCLEDAFAFFDGVPQELLFDNMATVRVPSTRKINPTMLDFAKHHGFTPKTHRSRRPRTKGKVERFGGYAQDNFLKGRFFENFDDLNSQNTSWLNHKANVRIHGTTKRRPLDDYNNHEKAVLQPLVPPYQGIPVRRKVNAEAMVHFKGNCYSVPPQLCMQEVTVESEFGSIRIRQNALIVAEHKETTGKGKEIAQREHLEERWRLSVPKDMSSMPLPDPEVSITALSMYEEAFG